MQTSVLSYKRCRKERRNPRDTAEVWNLCSLCHRLGKCGNTLRVYHILHNCRYKKNTESTLANDFMSTGAEIPFPFCPTSLQIIDRTRSPARSLLARFILSPWLTRQECWNLLVSSCIRKLIAKEQELNSKLGLPSVEANPLKSFQLTGRKRTVQQVFSVEKHYLYLIPDTRHYVFHFYQSTLTTSKTQRHFTAFSGCWRQSHAPYKASGCTPRKSNMIGRKRRNNCVTFFHVIWTTPHTN